jgi:putative ABC transport system ATP-binding protein
MQLDVEDVTVTINQRTVLQSVSLQARATELLVLAGVSGSGKSTLLNVLGLLQRPDSGAVRVDGADAARWGDSARREFWRRHVAFVFQDYGLIEEENIAFNVSIGKRPFRGLGTSDKERLDQVLTHVHLGGRNTEIVARLSGGEKQRVGLARAMFRRADLLLADEPTASLDRDNRELVTRYLREEAERGATVIVATHDEELISSSDRVVRLDAGRVA